MGGSREKMAIGKEMFDLSLDEKYPFCDDVSKTHAIEGGIPHLYHHSWQSLYRIARIEELKKMSLGPIEVTDGKYIRIKDVTFTSDYPSFALQFDGFPEFVLDIYSQNNKRRFRLLADEKGRKNHKLLGLVPSGETDKDLRTLYRYILINGLGLTELANFL